MKKLMYILVVLLATLSFSIKFINKNQNDKLLWDNSLFIADYDKELEKLIENKEEKTGKIIEAKRIGID